jgi:dienelactone hydrolase
MFLFRKCINNLLFIIIFNVAHPSHAESVTFPVGIFNVHSEILNNQFSREVMLNATLDLPELKNTPVPAVIIAHASGGVTSDVRVIARTLTRAGYAALYYDSYSPRDIQSTRSGRADLATLFQANDAYRGLRFLSSDPRIDTKKIAMIGMSIGGGSSISAAAESLRNRLMTNNHLRFAAHVAFYPGLHAAPQANNLSGAPILIIRGEDDDYQLPIRSQAWVDYVKAENPNYPIELAVIPGGPHSFLSEGLNYRSVPDYRNISHCPIFIIRPSEQIWPQWLSIDGQLHTRFEMCRGTTSGAHIGYDPRASELALKKLTDFLRISFESIK